MSELFVRTLRGIPPMPGSQPSLAGAYRLYPPRHDIYTWLPLGYRVLRNVERIVREEMDAIGAPEVHFPALLPKEPYEATGRWTEYGDSVFRLRDRKGGSTSSVYEMFAWSRTSTPPTRTCPSRSIRSRRSIATRLGRGPGCCEDASSSWTLLLRH